MNMASKPNRTGRGRVTFSDSRITGWAHRPGHFESPTPFRVQPDTLKIEWQGKHYAVKRSTSPNCISKRRSTAPPYNYSRVQTDRVWPTCNHNGQRSGQRPTGSGQRASDIGHRANNGLPAMAIICLSAILASKPGEEDEKKASGKGKPNANW